jgi:hypothetical protein
MHNIVAKHFSISNFPVRSRDGPLALYNHHQLIVYLSYHSLLRSMHWFSVNKQYYTESFVGMTVFEVLDHTNFWKSLVS